MNARFADPPVGGTIDHIMSVLPSLNPGAQRAALICVERPDEVVEMSGADLAEAAETSPATVSRMSKALGFRSFQHLRLLLVRDLGAAAQSDSSTPQGTAGRLQQLAERAGSMIQSSLASVDADSFEAAADAIAATPRLLVVGTGASAPPAQSAALAFVMNGRACEAPADGVAQQLAASTLRQGDVCLVVSSSGANAVTLAAATAAGDAGATVVGITSFAKSPLADRADLLLVTGARFRAWDPGALGSSLAQTLLVSALQMAVADRMADVAERARAAVRDEVLGIVTDADSDTDPDEAESPVSAERSRGQ